jgi:CheY-like chemotaxis protein
MARILVVEDNPQNLKLATVILRDLGHTVEGAPDAEEAEKRIAAIRPDLILMDLGLPGKDGYTFARELRTRPETEKIPILAVTSYAMRGDREKAMEAGCSGYLTKPIARRDLIQVVTDLLSPAMVLQ